MTATLRQIDSAIAAAKASPNDDSKAAAEALTTTVSQFQRDIANAAATFKDDADFNSYLAVARQVAQMIGQANADLTERQTAHQRAISDLKRSMGEKIQSRRKALFAADPALGKLMQDLAVQQHRLGAASAAGLNDDVAKIRARVDALNQGIAARQEQIAAAAGPGEEANAIQRLIGEQMNEVHRDGLRADQRIAEQVVLLEAAAPKIDDMTAAERHVINELGVRLMAGEDRPATDESVVFAG